MVVGALTEDLKNDLINDEGRRKSVYKDSRGYFTIGVGRCVDARLNCGLSPDEQDLLLDNDIQHVLTLCSRQTWYRALDTDNRRRACLNMVFNLGLGHFLGFSTFINLLEKKKFAAAADDLKTTAWHKEVGDRAVRIEALIRNG